MTDRISLERVKERRDALQGELIRGQEHVKKLERELETLKATMTRIVGALQVLDEMIAEEESPKGTG
jgi:hypothetical protein